jgi:pSer/pThr/pTyr-binding forkhead associated (FHA) protein
MGDSRLNSIHLEPARKNEFRLAREALLGARGNQTQAFEKAGASLWESEADPTATQAQIGEAAPVAGAKYVLIDSGRPHPLKVGLNTIGRMPDNDVVLNDPYVSRRHCAVLVHVAERCELHDIASKNGTFINGQKINGPTPLNSGDQITMCGKQLVFMAKNGGGEDACYHTVQMD